MEHIEPNEELPEKGETLPPAEKPEKPICPNCEHKMPRSAQFCPNCGQKCQSSRIKMRDLLLKLWNSTFHLESKFLRMCWQLLVPAKVTMAFFKGRIKRYPHPIQFFLICMFFFLLLLHFSDKGAPKFNLINLFGAKNLDEAAGKIVFCDELRQNWDSIPANLRNAKSKEALDSVLQFSAKSFDALRTDTFNVNVGSKIFTSRSYKIAYRDLLLLTPDSLCNLYGVDNFRDRFLIRQSIKASKEPGAVGQFWLSSMTWVLLSLVAIMAFWLKLLYIRQKRYYVEHFIWQIHLQAGFILVLMAAILLSRSHICPKVLAMIIPMLWIWYATYRGMRVFYGQGRAKTVLKWLIYWFLFFVSTLVLILLSILTSVLFF